MIDGSNIRYVQFRTNQGIGYGCFVINWSREEGELVYRVGSSFCSPKDRFSKTLARTIAQGRSLSNFQFGKIKSEGKYVNDIDFTNMLYEIMNNEDFCVVPNWARKAFNKGKCSFGLSQQIHNDIKFWKGIFQVNDEPIPADDKVTIINHLIAK